MNGLREDNIKIGYQGARGSFSEEAMIEFFGVNQNTFSYDKFEDVFLAIQKNEIDYGILPFENSCTGAITAVYDLLLKYGFYIVGEEYIKINQNLVGIKGAKVEDIKEIYSHPQGFEQSKKFLSQHDNAKLVYFYNTAISAKHISKLNDKSKNDKNNKDSNGIPDGASLDGDKKTKNTNNKNINPKFKNEKIKNDDRNIDEENLIDTESTDDDEITLNTKLERLKLNDKKTQGEEKIRIPLEYQDILKDN